MNWENLLTAERYGHNAPDTSEIGRSHFHKDHDRIVFSSAFRRLGRKTQVHPLSMNDHIHTRLTHSLEVGSIGRSLGILAGERLQDELPSWITASDIGMIVQAACLAHDIGNPPFGHAGEDVIRDWFRDEEHAYLLDDITCELERADLLTFEGNAQGLRIVTQLQNNLFDGGLRLTYPTIGALIKYPRFASNALNGGKFSIFQSERELFENISAKLGLKKNSDNTWARHPLSYLMEAADDICYAILDLEDAVELNILNFNEIYPILQMICGGTELNSPKLESNISARRKISELRGQVMQSMVDAVTETFISNIKDIMAGTFEGDLLSSTKINVRDGLKQAKKLAQERVFRDQQKSIIEIGSYTTLGILMDAFMKTAHEFHCKGHDKLPYRGQKMLDLMQEYSPKKENSLYQNYMRVLDFISGMTDNYASELAKRIGGLP